MIETNGVQEKKAANASTKPTKVSCRLHVEFREAALFQEFVGVVASVIEHVWWVDG